MVEKQKKVMPEREKRIKIDTESHTSTILHQLNEMRETKEGCDFTIVLGSEEIFAHANVLIAGSEYFRAMLTHDTKEKQTGILTMEKAEPTCVKKCVGFIYTGEPPEFEDNIEPLMYVASLMQLSTICDGIVELLDDNLELESFLVTWGIADRYDRKQLVEKCVRFALENIEDIAKLDGFDKSCIQKLLNSIYYGIPEEIKLRALVCWVRFDSEERVQVMDEMLKVISLSKTNVDYLLNLLKNEPLINEDDQRKKLFSRTLTEKTSHIAIFDPRLRTDYLNKLNPNDGSYKRIKKVNEGIMDKDFSAVCVENYIYVLKDNKSVYRFRYLVKSAAWERMEDMLEDHGCSPPAVVMKNIIYLIGGCNLTTKSVETYDTLSGRWIKLADKPQASAGSTPVVLNGQIYCCGGRVDEVYTNAVEQFNPDSAVWNSVAPMNEAKGFVAAIAFHEKLYALGGFESANLATAECYDLDENSWTLLKPMNTARSWFQSFVIKGEIYAVGGYFDRTKNSIEKYNPEKNVWVDVTILGKIKIKESVKIKIQRSEIKRK